MERAAQGKGAGAKYNYVHTQLHNHLQFFSLQIESEYLHLIVFALLILCIVYIVPLIFCYSNRYTVILHWGNYNDHVIHAYHVLHSDLQMMFQNLFKSNRMGRVN